MYRDEIQLCIVSCSHTGNKLDNIAESSLFGRFMTA